MFLYTQLFNLISDTAERGTPVEKDNKDKTVTGTRKWVLSRQEENLLNIIRSMDFGEVRVVITDGKPQRIEEIRKSIKL